MRKEQLINDNWLFRYHDGTETRLNIPHTWNAKDGQDGGNDYWRGTCVYEKDFPMPDILPAERCDTPYRCWYYDFCHKE